MSPLARIAALQEWVQKPLIYRLDFYYKRVLYQFRLGSKTCSPFKISYYAFGHRFSLLGLGHPPEDMHPAPNQPLVGEGSNYIQPAFNFLKS